MLRDGGRTVMGRQRAGEILQTPRLKARRWLTLALLALTALAALSTWSFLTRPAGNDELASVRRENARLREINRSFERSLQHLQTRLSEQETRIGELALVAGVERASSRVEGTEPPVS